MAFLNSLKTLFAGQEVEITVKSLESSKDGIAKEKNGLMDMIRENRLTAPIIAKNIDIRSLIDEGQAPDYI